MTTVDARGYSCPEPVIMLPQGNGKERTRNIRFWSIMPRRRKTSPVTQSTRGYSVTVSENGGEYTLSLKK